MNIYVWKSSFSITFYLPFGWSLYTHTHTHTHIYLCVNVVLICPLIFSHIKETDVIGRYPWWIYPFVWHQEKCLGLWVTVSFTSFAFSLPHLGLKKKSDSVSEYTGSFSQKKAHNKKKKKHILTLSTNVYLKHDWDWKRMSKDLRVHVQTALL